MKQTSKTPEEEIYLVPELNIRISMAWIRVIRFVQTSLPNGQLCVKINNAQPGRLVWEHTKKDIRFDKEQDIPIDFGEIGT